MKQGSLGKFLEFLSKLEKMNASYRLEHIRDDSIMVFVAVPGERWEIEFFDDMSVEIEIFKSDGVIEDEGKLEVLYKFLE